MLNWSTSYTSSLRRPSYRRHVLDGLRATPQIRCSLLLVWIILSTSEVALDVPASTLQRADEMRSLLKRMSGFVHQCVPVHGPEAVSEPILIQSPAMIG